ncbi:ParB/RepB/Spo0J family partition protein [Streptomyces sp. NBC_01455]|uniref:ParB/RepB/Spo0J family partition protein n=1 Tax=Streptomyces sp. NBC_01455 TaxID=2903874 RepID=UPI002E370C82|nr:ParB/RepB/Spo0J family partition protein [Streptomyces sp. NBC_01455]
MSKADQLGAGRFGGGVRSVSARRQAVAAATGVPTDGVAPPTQLSPSRISPNPDNPRSKLGDLTDLTGSLKNHGQKQAITVMNRDAYLKANPDRESDLEPDTAYVVIDGSSRLAAAREAGLEAIAVMVSDDQGNSPEELLKSALIANIMRNDLSEIDEARALQRLLVVYGSQRALAKELHRSQGWVSQRLALLNLTPELQDRIGEEPIELLRAVGSKPVSEQETALEELKAQRAAAESAKTARKQPERIDSSAPTDSLSPAEASVAADPPAPAKAPALDEASAPSEMPVPAEAPAPEAVGGDYAVITTDSSAASPLESGPVEPRTRTDTVPDPRSDGAADTRGVGVGERTPPKLPYDDGSFLAMHLIRKMSDTEFDKMLRILNSHQAQRDESVQPAAQ